MSRITENQMDYREYVKLPNTDGFTHLEVKACKVLYLYLFFERNIFPDIIYTKYPRKDPRKSLVFKYCYKLVNETQNRLTEQQYPLYVKAQLEIFKNLNKNLEEPCLVGPHILAGDKAWRRWKVWSKYFEERLANDCRKDIEELANNKGKIIAELKNTKNFLQENLGNLNRESVTDALNDGDLLKWMQLNLVSGYFIALSPVCQGWLKSNSVDLMEEYTYDVSLYRKNVSAEVENFFKKEFEYEFVSN
jgi:hypothetical protein